VRFRLGLLLGFAIGYVLGAKAGRERYDQIVNTCRGFMEMGGVKDVTGKVKETVGEGMTAASEAIRNTIDT
jgi:hypothetical protein